MVYFNPLKTIIKVENKINRKYKNFQKLEEGIEDDEIANFIVKLIDEKFQRTINIEQMNTLDEVEENEEEAFFGQVEEASSSLSSIELSPKKFRIDSVAAQFDENTLKNIYEFVKNRGYSYQKAVDKWPKLKNKSNVKTVLDDYEREKENKGTNLEKFNKIKNFMIIKFREARESGAAVHYWTLQEWSRIAAKQLRLDGFKASKHFINNFKKENKITSRKITKITSHILNDDEKILLDKSVEFNQEVNKFIKENHLKASEVWNHDQSPYQYEMTSERTLSVQGS